MVDISAKIIHLLSTRDWYISVSGKRYWQRSIKYLDLPFSENSKRENDVNRVYLAAPLFSLAEKNFNSEFVQRLKEITNDFEFVLAQERARQFIGLKNRLRLIFEDCLETIGRSDVVIGILDGYDGDSGTCVELGFAYARGIPVIGVRTHFRASEESGLNLMLSNLCNVLIWNTDADIDGLTKEVARNLDNLFQ